jgi:hypothetical protein
MCVVGMSLALLVVSLYDEYDDGRLELVLLELLAGIVVITVREDDIIT